MLNPSLFSSDNDTWETPADLFAALDAEFNFTLDPCCTITTAKCMRFFTPKEDGLQQSWEGNVYMNPPYGRGMTDWVRKAFLASIDGATVVCLLPTRTDTRWWHAYCMRAAEIRFLTKRLTFAGATNKAPMPCAIVVFRPRTRRLLVSAYSVE